MISGDGHGRVGIISEGRRCTLIGGTIPQAHAVAVVQHVPFIIAARPVAVAFIITIDQERDFVLVMGGDATQNNADVLCLHH